MKKLDKDYYAKILGKDVNSIEEIGSLNKVAVDSNVHRSKIYFRIIKYKGGEIDTLLHKVMPKPEYKRANHHEEAVLSFSYELYKKLPEIHYSTPRLLDHIPDERTLLMEYVEGESLAQRIQSLDTKINNVEDELRINDRSSKEKGILWSKFNAINEIKKAFIKLGLKGLAEFQYFTKIYIEDLKEALAIENLSLYDPLKHDDKNHYKNKIIGNLIELLDKYNVGYNKKRLLEDLLKANPLGKVPINSLVEKINAYDSDRIIISDYHPFHIIPIHSEEIDSMVKQIVRIDNLEKYDEEMADLLIKKIEKEGKIVITDLGDVRIGHELFDFVDLTRNHIFALRPNEVDELLQYFLRERQHLRSEDVGDKYAKYHDMFIMIDAYRALRAAVKTEKEWEKIFYLEHLVEDLSYHSELQPLKDVILSYINSTIENIQGILDESNGVKVISNQKKTFSARNHSSALVT